MATQRLFAVGSFGALDRWNPSFLIKQQAAWPLLNALAEEPRSAAALGAALGVTTTEVTAQIKALAELNLVRPLGAMWGLGFAWFTPADQDAVYAAVAPLAQDLAARIHDHRDEYDAALGRIRAATWADPRDIRFAIIGCFGLDWGGLDELKAAGYLVHGKQQPGGRDYVAFVEEPVPAYSVKDYVGSHSGDAGEDATWTSFGDHSGRRFALPDLIWAGEAAIAESERLPGDHRSLLATVAGPATLQRLTTAMVRITQGADAPDDDRALLERLGAVAAGRPLIPVFFWEDDGVRIEAVVASVREIILTCVNRYYPRLQAELAHITPGRDGIPFRECFNPIWHFAFGEANRILAESGYLADPEPSMPGEGRYRWWLTIGKGHRL